MLGRHVFDKFTSVGVYLKNTRGAKALVGKGSEAE